jgi:hypothetical protein
VGGEGGKGLGWLCRHHVCTQKCGCVPWVVPGVGWECQKTGGWVSSQGGCCTLAVCGVCRVLVCAVCGGDHTLSTTTRNLVGCWLHTKASGTARLLRLGVCAGLGGPPPPHQPPPPQSCCA